MCKNSVSPYVSNRQPPSVEDLILPGFFFIIIIIIIITSPTLGINLGETAVPSAGTLRVGSPRPSDPHVGFSHLWDLHVIKNHCPPEFWVKICEEINLKVGIFVYFDGYICYLWCLMTNR